MIAAGEAGPHRRISENRHDNACVRAVVQGFDDGIGDAHRPYNLPMGGGRPAPRTTSLSVWGTRLLTVVLVMLAVSLVWAWVQESYRGVDALSRLSYVPNDKPGTLPNDHLRYAEPIVGDHYFGDFQVPLSYARDLRDSISPYLRGAPEQYPPFTQVLFVPLTFLPVHASVWLYLFAMAVIFLAPLWLLLSRLGAQQRIQFLVPTAILTTGFIGIMDRGNDVGIAVGCVAWALWAWKTERSLLSAVFLAVAIALKAYPAALLIVPLALRRYRYAVGVAGAALVANLIPLLLYPGGLSRNLAEVTSATRGQSPPLYQLVSWSLYSVIPKTSGLLLGPLRVYDLLAPKGPLIWLPSLLYAAGLYFVIARGRIPQWCWGPLALASLQLVVPVSLVYTTAWAAIGAVWYSASHLVDIDGRSRAIDDDDTAFVTLRILLLAAIAATLTPSVLTFAIHHGFSTPFTRWLSPVLLFVTMAVAVVQSVTTPSTALRPSPTSR
jgi:hypothetical protein